VSPKPSPTPLLPEVLHEEHHRILKESIELRKEYRKRLEKMWHISLEDRLKKSR
jgi:hypothetical protein